VRARYHIGTLGNPLFPGLFERAAMTVSGSIMAAKLACEGYLVFHPSGGTHHGRPDRASGFCFFNDPVFAILTLLKEGRARVLYVDLDAHHGDGVEDAFLDQPTVILGGGGYNPWTVTRYWAGLWGRLSDQEFPQRLPDQALALLRGVFAVMIGAS